MHVCVNVYTHAHSPSAPSKKTWSSLQQSSQTKVIDITDTIVFKNLKNQK